MREFYQFVQENNVTNYESHVCLAVLVHYNNLQFNRYR